MSRCHDPSGCTNEGMWHSWPWRWDKSRKVRVHLCAQHWARWNRWAVEFPSTKAVQDAKERHPSHYAAGREAVVTWLKHPEDCTCQACGYVDANADSAVDG